MTAQENPLTQPADTDSEAPRLLGLFYRNGHVYGAVFTMGKDGTFHEYMPMDFFGTTPKTHTKETAEFGLLIPISHQASGQLATVMDTIKDNRTHKRYYYKSGTLLEFNAAFERTGCNPVDYDGREIFVNDEEKTKYKRAPGAPAIIPTNCIHMLLNACRHSAYIPLQDLDPSLTNTYQADALPYAIDRIAFYGEELSSPVDAKWVDVPGGSAVITLHANRGNMFRIPDDMNSLRTATGADGAASLLAKIPLDHTVVPGSKVTEKTLPQRVALKASQNEGMSEWL